MTKWFYKRVFVGAGYRWSSEFEPSEEPRVNYENRHGPTTRTFRYEREAEYFMETNGGRFVMRTHTDRLSSVSVYPTWSVAFAAMATSLDAGARFATLAWAAVVTPSLDAEASLNVLLDVLLEAGEEDVQTLADAWVFADRMTFDEQAYRQECVDAYERARDFGTAHFTRLGKANACRPTASRRYARSTLPNIQNIPRYAAEDARATAAIMSRAALLGTDLHRRMLAIDTETGRDGSAPDIEWRWRKA